MTGPKVAANYSVLRWARETANLTVEDVASKMGRPPEIIQAWEAGEDRPTYVQLETLSYQIYKRPIAIFFFPEPPEEDSPTKSFRTLPDVELDALTPNLTFLLRRARVMQMNLRELCDGRNPSTGKAFEHLQLEPGAEPGNFVEGLRAYLDIDLVEQKSWRDSRIAFDRWRDAIVSKGVFVFLDAFRQEDVCGFCLYDPEFPLIYMDNSKPSNRKIFTLFHELAHLLFKTGGIDKYDDGYIEYLSGDSRHIERFCNRFAADFLVPDTDFEDSIASYSRDVDLIAQEASHEYSVSREVILWKLVDLDMLSPRESRDLVDEWQEEANKLAGRRPGGNYYNTRAYYLGKTYLNIAFGKYYRSEIDLGDLARYLGTKVSSVPGLEMALERQDR